MVDLGSLVNVVSTKLLQKIKLCPDLNHTQVYGTAGVASTKALGAYSALSMRFGKLLLMAPMVVLENKTYHIVV